MQCSFCKVGSGIQIEQCLLEPKKYSSLGFSINSRPFNLPSMNSIIKIGSSSCSIVLVFLSL